MRKTLVVFASIAVLLTLSGLVMAEEITVVGTGSGMSVLKAVGNAFARNHPGIRIVVPESIGSSGGIKTVGNDKYKIARVAREIKDTEKHYGLTYVPVCKMPIVFFVNKSVGISNLTTEQVCDIYSGKIINWKMAGGKNARIKVIRREDGDSSLRILQKSFPGFADIRQTTNSKTTFTDQETCRLAERKADTIAYVAYNDAKDYDVNVLAINGQKPTDPAYPYTAVLALVLKEKNYTGNIKKFVEFATSAGAHDAIKNSGALPF